MSERVGDPATHLFTEEARGAREARLLKRYQELVAKYERAIERQQVDTRNSCAISRLSWWALQRSSEALALVSRRCVLVSNAHWKHLRAGHGRWTPASPAAAPGRGRPLSLVVEEESDALWGSRDVLRVLRLRREDGKGALELRLERLPPAHDQLTLVSVRELSWERPRGEGRSRGRGEPGLDERLTSLDRLASGVVHDLASSLLAMRLRVEQLAADPRLASVRGKELRELKLLLDDGSQRVHRFQRAARAGQGGLEAVDLTGILEDAVNLVRPELERRRAGSRRRIRIETSFGALPRVPGAAAELRQVMTQLLLNARDAMPDGGRIRLGASAEADRVVVRIEDEGKGIALEHLPRLFEPFFTTKGELGTGIGLASAREVMERLGGTLTGANRPEGGAVFTLTFPIADVPATRPALEPPLEARRRVPVAARRGRGRRSSLG